MTDPTSDAEEFEAPGILITTKDNILTPLRYATSKSARRTYIQTTLFLVSALILLLVAVLAYLLFYHTYIPIRGFQQPLHLQFHAAHAHAPFARASLSHRVLSAQRYDVAVALRMPRSPGNRGAGNFMLDVALTVPAAAAEIAGAVGVDDALGLEQERVLVRERRPAILTYRSRGVEWAFRLLRLPLYVLGWGQEEEKLVVKVMEGVEFELGWGTVPTGVRVEVVSEEKLQVYDMDLVVRARLRGLRYLMYNFRLTSFVVLTLTFWFVEMFFAIAIWFILSLCITPSKSPTHTTTDLKPSSPGWDGPPVYGHELGDIKIKKEEPEDDETTLPPLSVPAEADIEDEGEDDPGGITMAGPSARSADRDSGIGTSLESSGLRRTELVRRRSGRGGRGGFDA